MVWNCEICARKLSCSEKLRGASFEAKDFGDALLNGGNDLPQSLTVGLSSERLKHSDGTGILYPKPRHVLEYGVYHLTTILWKHLSCSVRYPDCLTALITKDP